MQAPYKTIYQRKQEEGQLFAERKTLQRQIMRRFGEVTAYWQKRIDNAEPSQLEQWLDNFVDAETIEQVFQ